MIKPALWFLAILTLFAFVGNRELNYREQINLQAKEIDRLVKDYRNANLMLHDTHRIGYALWSEPPVIKGWMDSQTFLRRLVDELENRGCEVVISKGGAE